MSACSCEVCVCVKSYLSRLSWLLVTRVHIVWVSASCDRLTIMSLEMYCTIRNSVMGLEMYFKKRNSFSPHVVAIYMDTRVSVF
jgi:hypothetical protein